tara:strand:- start:518 stop:1201 length:684 start_codon:yes stop_codon:yes gene_type:complete
MSQSKSRRNRSYNQTDLIPILESRIISLKKRVDELERDAEVGAIGSNLFRSQVPDRVEVFQVLPEHDNKAISVEVETDNWVINLPSIDTVDESFTIMIVRKTRDLQSGRVNAYGGDLIDGIQSVSFFGKGSMIIRKIPITGGYTWYVFFSTSFEDTPNQGKTVVKDFSDTREILVIHNYGYVPKGVEVWTYEGGVLVDASCNVVHDWDNKNSFVVHLPTESSGKVLY